MKSMIFSCKFLRVCALPVPAEGDSSAGRALSPASVRSEPAWSTDPASVMIFLLFEVMMVMMIVVI